MTPLRALPGLRRRRSRAWMTVPGSDPALPGDYELARCRSCGTAVTLAPVPAEAHESGAYGGGAPRAARLVAPFLRALRRQRLAQLSRGRRAARPGGCWTSAPGRGRFVAQARAAGWYAHGIEPSQRGVEGAQAIGIELVAGGIDDAHVPPGSLDAATLWHVLEHVEDPGAALERIAGWLRPGGTAARRRAEPRQRAGARRRRALVSPRRPAPPHALHGHAAWRRCCARTAWSRSSTRHVLAEHNPFGLWVSFVSRSDARAVVALPRAEAQRPAAQPRRGRHRAGAAARAARGRCSRRCSGSRRRGGTVSVVARRV